jgi:hypothetical protein
MQYEGVVVSDTFHISMFVPGNNVGYILKHPFHDTFSNHTPMWKYNQFYSILLRGVGLRHIPHFNAWKIQPILFNTIKGWLGCCLGHIFLSCFWSDTATCIHLTQDSMLDSLPTKNELSKNNCLLLSAHAHSCIQTSSKPY